MGMQYGGAPAGPAGTGKTETVKDMGRSMGVFVLVTNCAPAHRYKNMAEILSKLHESDKKKVLNVLEENAKNDRKQKTLNKLRNKMRKINQLRILGILLKF